MAENILTVAAREGGSIRSFEQQSVKGDIKGNCMVHSARWLRAKQKQGDFINKYGTHSVLFGTMPQYRHFRVEEARFKTDRGYEEAYKGMGAQNGEVHVRLERRGPSENIESKASTIRSLIKPPGTFSGDEKLERFVEQGGKGLRKEPAAKILFRRDKSENIPLVDGWKEKLLSYFSAPGYYFAGLYSYEVSHAVAFFVTEKEFWYFDPSYGELKLDNGQVAAWLKHEDVGSYFTNKRTFIAITTYISEA